MTRRLAINSAGIFISRPGYDALDDSVVRLVEPDYPMLSQHTQGTATSVFTEGSSAGGWSRHRATFNFDELPYRPMVHFAMAYNSSGKTLDTVQYPEYLISHTPSGSVVPGGRYKILTDRFWAEAIINSYVTANAKFRMIVTIYKADSGLAL